MASVSINAVFAVSFYFRRRTTGVLGDGGLAGSMICSIVYLLDDEAYREKRNMCIINSNNSGILAGISTRRAAYLAQVLAWRAAVMSRVLCDTFFSGTLGRSSRRKRPVDRRGAWA